MFTFDLAILLRGVDRRGLVNDTLGFIKSTHEFGFKLKSIITTDGFDGFGKLLVDHVTKVLNELTDLSFIMH